MKEQKINDWHWYTLQIKVWDTDINIILDMIDLLWKHGIIEDWEYEYKTKNK